MVLVFLNLCAIYYSIIGYSKVYKYIVKPNLSYHNNEVIPTISLDEHCNNIQEKKREAMRKFAQNASEERRDIPE